MKRYVCLLVIFFCGIAVVQAQDSTFEGIIQQAQNALHNKEYSKAIPLYLKTLTFSESKSWSWGFHYNLSCCYALTDDPGNALDQLEKSIQCGNQDYRMINDDPDLNLLKSQYSEKFKVLIEMAKQSERDTVLMQSPIAVVEYKNFDGSTDISSYIWDDYHHPLMDSLRRTYQLEKIVSGRKDEFGKMKLLLNRVATRWQHNGNNTCKDQNALAILAGAEKGERFACVDYGTVLTQCLIALGYPARSMGIMKYGVAIGNGKGHRCTKV